MRTDALVLLKPGKMDFTRITVPDPGPADVVVEMKANGICRADIALFTGKLNFGYPCHHGHEPVGIVAEVGKGVKGVKAGDKVACLGSPTYRRHAVFHSSQVAKIPDQSADLTNWVIEPVACAVHGMQASNLALGSKVALIGCGYMGLLLLQAMPRELLGRLVVVEPDARRQDLARQFGACEVYHPRDKELPELAKKLNGFDTVIEASGAKGTITLGTQLLRVGGTLNIFGWHAGTEQIPTHDWHYKGLLVINPSPMFSPNFHAYFRPTVAMMASGRIDQRALITHRFPFEKSQQAFEAIANGLDGYMKGVLCF